MKVRDIMNRNVARVDADTPVSTLAQRMRDEALAAVFVMGPSGELAGIVTETELAPRTEAVPFSRSELPTLLGEWASFRNLEQDYRHAGSLPAKAAMRGAPGTVADDAEAASAVELMLRLSAEHLVATHEGDPVGVVGRRELLGLISP